MLFKEELKLGLVSCFCPEISLGKILHYFHLWELQCIKYEMISGKLNDLIFFNPVFLVGGTVATLLCEMVTLCMCISIFPLLKSEIYFQ